MGVKSFLQVELFTAQAELRQCVVLTGRAMAEKSSRHQRLRPRICVKSLENHFERLPPEVLLKILGYLDAGSLHCLTFLNKSFHQLADDNALWYRFYSDQRARSRHPRRLCDDNDHGGDDDDGSMSCVWEKPRGHWRQRFFKELAGVNQNWRKKLQGVHPYTGLPGQTKQLLKSLGVTWHIVLTDEKGRESTFQQTGLYLGEASCTVSWSATCWPNMEQLHTLRLCGVVPVPLKCPNSYKPGRRSLFLTAILKKDSWRLCATDKLVTLLYMEQGIMLGVWQELQESAFIMVNLHYHKIVERVLLGSYTTEYQPPEVKAPFDDVDPDYGLHSYTAHLSLHNTEESITSARFTHLFCRRDGISEGYVHLRAIRKNKRSEHLLLQRNITLPWKSEALHGIIEGCCVLTLTVLDETQTPFWCVCAPVAMIKTDPSAVLFDFSGQNFSLQHCDSGGRVDMDLEWREGDRQYFISSLDISLPVSRVNHHFGRNY